MAREVPGEDAAQLVRAAVVDEPFDRERVGLIERRVAPAPPGVRGRDVDDVGFALSCVRHSVGGNQMALKHNQRPRAHQRRRSVRAGDHGSKADREPAYPNRRDDEADATGRDSLRQVDGARVGVVGRSGRWTPASPGDPISESHHQSLPTAELTVSSLLHRRSHSLNNFRNRTQVTFIVRSAEHRSNLACQIRQLWSVLDNPKIIRIVVL